ncbi:hypothetical protein C2S52_016184 [Perilla frutescens var. hirtella]|nr:hypothetical protein C2S52_016184 [Perilla frutescens var. hirtella]KAH6815071.1 hypothetical protein C2S51_019891 [Perilla frutescens var. frutescens]
MQTHIPSIDNMSFYNFEAHEEDDDSSTFLSLGPPGQPNPQSSPHRPSHLFFLFRPPFRNFRPLPSPVLDPFSRPNPRRPDPILLLRLQQNIQQIQQHADAHVGARIGIPEGAGIPPRHEAGVVDSPAAVLLLRGGVQEQHRASAVEAAEGFPDAADSLQAEARHEAVRLPEMREAVRRARRLADAREELREAVVLHLRLRLQAQEIAQGSRPRLRTGACAAQRQPLRLRSHRG